MKDDYTATVRLVRPKAYTDDVGGTVWNEPVEPVELDLVSTRALQILIDDDPDTLTRLRELEAGSDGVLAHERGGGKLEVVPRQELRAALGAAGHLADKTDHVKEALYVARQVAEGIDEQTLVSTRVIQKLLNEPGLSPDQAADELRLVDEPGGCGGFDPYNKS